MPTLLTSFPQVCRKDTELYPEQIVDSIISTAFDGKFTDKDIPIIAISSISFYVIKDTSKASREGINKKDDSDMMSRFIIEGALEKAKADGKLPCMIVSTLNGGGHYQGITMLFKRDNHVDVTVINSINKLKNMSEQETLDQLRTELYILNNLGYTIDKLIYKEHFLQDGNHECGPCTIANIYYELKYPNQATTPTRLNEMESIMLRANHAYQMQFKSNPPDITMIDGKDIKKSNNPQSQHSIFTEPRTNAMAADKSITPQSLLARDISEKCQEFFGATKEQGEKLACIALAKGKKEIDDHMSYLFAEWSNHNGNIDNVIKAHPNEIMNSGVLGKVFK